MDAYNVAIYIWVILKEFCSSYTEKCVLKTDSLFLVLSVSVMVVMGYVTQHTK